MRLGSKFGHSAKSSLSTHSVQLDTFDVNTDMQLPVVFLIATVLNAVWNLRVKGGRVQQYLVRSELEAKINLLRETRHQAAANKLKELAVTMFQ